MKRTVQDFLLDMRTAIEEVQAFTAGMIFEEFAKDRKTINAVIRSLEVLGEAAKNIPGEMANRYPEVPWKRVIGMRDKLIHGYHGVDLETVWQTICQQVPPLKPVVEKMLLEAAEQDRE